MRAVAMMLLVVLDLSCLGGERRCKASKLAEDERMFTFKGMHIQLSAERATQTLGLRKSLCIFLIGELKSQNLTGELPSEFASLTQLNYLSLSCNYLNGSILAAWASLPLTHLSLRQNRISGRIPEELGNISTLQHLILINNLLGGSIPASLGNLTSLTWLLLTDNNFSGELPESFGNLKNMSDMRIDGNPISGKIPYFLGNWTRLQKLDMQGTSLEGPFPPNFANLSNITELRVSDLKGGDGKFPSLTNMKGLKTLVLRNLSISGQIPDYIGTFPLTVLDLSFNNLSGTVPSNFAKMENFEYIFLTSNMLEGSIPSWILNSNDNLDLSYNNFNGSPTPESCHYGNMNFVSSYSFPNNSSILPCLQRNFPCSENPNYELFINCGGSMVTIGDREYEADDQSPLGATMYAESESKRWAYSSTGYFVYRQQYIITNTSILNMSNPELYTSARLSPLSLKYYGLCLQNGSYNVSLHFAEIIFTDDQTFSSSGRRIFDVSIQVVKSLATIVFFEVKTVSNEPSVFY